MVCSYPFQQNNNMYYLTGFNEPDSCLVIEKDATGHSVSMFVMPNDEHSMLWSGPRAGLDGVRSFFGIQQVYEQRKLSDLVNELVRKRPAVFVDYVPDSSSLDSALYMRLSKWADCECSLNACLRVFTACCSVHSLRVHRAVCQPAGRNHAIAAACQDYGGTRPVAKVGGDCVTGL